LLKLTGPC